MLKAGAGRTAIGRCVPPAHQLISVSACHHPQSVVPLASQTRAKFASEMPNTPQG